MSVAESATSPNFDAEFNEEGLKKFQEIVDDLKQRSEITDLDYLGAVNDDFGTIHRYGFITKAGYTYAANGSIPNESSSDIPILYTGAWTTSTRGLNENTAGLLMRKGLASFHVGNEGSYHSGKYPMPRRGMTLAGTAAAALAFSGELATGEFKYLVDERLRTAIGESKGGMEGKALPVLAPFFDQEVLMADFTADSIPRRPTPKEMLKFSEQLLIHEPRGAAQLAGRLALNVLLKMPSTLDPHPYAVAHQIAKTPAIMSGESGDIGRLIDKDFKMHGTIFKGDGWSMKEDWLKIYKDHSNVRITELEGVHLTLADPQTRAFIVARQMAFRDLYEQHSRKMTDENGVELFSGDDIWELAHEYYQHCSSELPGGLLQSLVRLAMGGDNNKPDKFAPRQTTV